MSFQIRPKLRSKLPQALAALIVAAASSAALADELTTPPAPESPARPMCRPVARPWKRSKPSSAPPASACPAVGEPPITRWKYPGFEVYFEHQLVIHTVVSS